MGRMTRQEKLRQTGDISRIICNIETSHTNTKIINLLSLQEDQTSHFYLVPFYLTSINWNWTMIIADPFQLKYFNSLPL